MIRPVSQWDFSLSVDLNSGDPVFLQIARALAADIRRGRIRPGTRLPGSRTLAQTLSVHRNTVVAAYNELLAEGWLQSSRASGTFVSRSLPEVKPRRFSQGVEQRTAVPVRLGFELEAVKVGAPSPAPPPGTLVLSGGLPDLRLAPVELLARAYRRALNQHGRSLLGFNDAYGHPRLRTAVASMLATTRGLATTQEEILVTRGSQMAFDLVSRALLRSGDVVAVEAYGYRLAWEAFRHYGAKLVPLPVDEQGLRVDALEELARKEAVRAVYVTPHHQYPTMVTMTASRRIALLELARRLRLAVIEDDYDHEFHFDGRPVLPLASADQAGVVIYVGTLTKILAPGLRLGYVAAPRPLLEAMAHHRRYVDRQGDYALECSVAELMEDGEIQRHTRRAKRLYQARRDLLAERLRKAFGDSLTFEIPSGGMALWVKASPSIDVDHWSAQAVAQRVSFATAKSFAFDGRPRPFVRLGFASQNEAELTEAVKRLKASLP